MFSDFQHQLTYYGVLDDVVDRYPWPARIDLHSIQHQLITSALYGKRVLINDGYLLANPMLIDDLANPGHSLTGTLLRCDAARLFTRSGGSNLAEGIERTAAHVATHRALVSDKQRWPTLRRALEDLSSDVGQRNIAWPRDKNMGEIFYLLMERIAGMSGPQGDRIVPPGMRRDFDAIFALFRTLMTPSFDGARNYWEEACWRHIAGYDIDPLALGTLRMEKDRVAAFPEYPRVVPFMNIAIEIYHLAYAAGAAWSVAASTDAALSGANLGVATALVTAFPDLAGQETVAPDEGIDEATLQRMNQLIITIPPDIEFAGDFDFIFDIRRKAAIREAGEAYLTGLELFSRGGIDFAEGLRRRDAYVEQLAQTMAPKLRFKKKWVAAKGLSDLLLAAATTPVNFAAGWLLSFGLDPLRNRLIERMLKARVGNALREEGLRAASAGVGRDGARPVPLARTVGLYLGPLRDDGMKRLVAPVAPHPSVKLPVARPDALPAPTGQPRARGRDGRFRRRPKSA